MVASLHRRRRVVAALGMLVPGLGFVVVSAYVALGYGGGCGGGGGCAGNTAEVAVVTFPGAVLCLVLGAAVLRGQRWARWPAVVMGGALATVVAAGALAGVVAMGGDGSDVRGAIAVGLVGVALAAICALPSLLLSGEQGANSFPG